METTKLYRLVAAGFAGIAFAAPSHVWTGGEVIHSWNFQHPYSLEEIGGRYVITGQDGDTQEWAPLGLPERSEDEEDAE